MINFESAMEEYLGVVRAVTGNEPIKYNADTGTFDMPLPAGRETSDEMYDAPKQVKCLSGRIQVVQGSESEYLGPGAVSIIAANVNHHLKAMVPSQVAFCFL